jgi:hypothetical protein
MPFGRQTVLDPPEGAAAVADLIEVLAATDSLVYRR